ncbi:hypothetical protein BBP40_000216 [Aspergillus hancockii]|nr:hypothetical protein BBP40_000216 [Aspergillus hancockii]
MPSMSSQKMCLEANLYLVHHVFLPPKLPQEDDYKPEYELVLLEKCIEALQQFKVYVSDSDADSIAAAATMVTRLAQTCGPNGDVDEKELRIALTQLYTEGGILPVYVHCQNAAVLMTRDGNAIRIETFELSARNEAVMTTIGRLKRQFPGPTLSIDLETFIESGLQTTIAQTLAKMGHQPVAGTHAKVKKAGQKHDEDRDTTHPMMVTEFLSAFLRPLCTSVVCSQIQKNTREEVMWLDSRSPWRRSSLWLLLRVVLQLMLCRRAVHRETPDDLYKQFMIFFMSCVVSASPSTICSEHLHTMISKISRRLLKLGTPNNRGWISHVREVLKTATNIMEKRWHEIIARRGRQSQTKQVARLDFGSDIYYILPELDNYLAEIGKRRIMQPVNEFLPHSNLVEFPSTDLPLHLDFTEPEYKAYNLAAFEHWVACNLETWLETHLSDEGTCNRLGTIIKNYYEIAFTSYASNPEALSVMMLTTLELWIACDKSATRLHTVLCNYDACIPMELFESLLLPFRSQMARLDRAESYLRLRKQRAIHSGPGVFRDYGTPDCFAVRYFDQSETHQRLLSTIEESARREREDKKAELRRKRQQCADLYALYDRMQCTYEEVILDKRFNFRESRHSVSCKRCEYKRQADAMKWQNILRQLAMPSIDLKKPETCIFILQIINQVGPSTARLVTRTAHDILKDTAFTTALLGRIQDIAARLEENWEMAQGLSALSSLVLRVLTLSPSADIQEICLTTLKHLRKISFAWVKIVTEKASSTTDDRRRSDLLLRSGHLALICATTFDAEDIVLVRMLENISDTAVLLQCSIELPRLRLRFELKPRTSAIQSREYQGMFIDPDQSLDTLVGLRNRLILRHESGGDRVVLIPEGQVSWYKDNGHIAVEIGWQAATTLHPYAVDNQLGRLTDNGSLHSRSILCYLHALTSFCLPDPLTQRTGTEQALTILRSASMRSFDRLHPEDSLILAKIAELTPERHYYPSNERVMQTVRWDKHLGFLAQHDSFYKQVKAIFDHDNRMRMFHPNEQVKQPPLPHIDPDLLTRTEIRSSSFRVAGFGAEDHTVEYDRPYVGLDLNRNSARFCRVYRLCKILYEEIPSAREILHVDLLSKLWQFLSQTHVVHAASLPVDSNKIKYDAALILEPMAFVSSHWCSLHQLLCSRDSGLSKFQLMVWLATLAFSDSSNMVVLEILASLYVIPEMADLTLPSRGPFQLWHGYEVDEAILGSRIRQSAVLSHTPESNLHPLPNETLQAFQARKRRIAKQNRTLALQTFIRGLKDQWPIRSPTIPPQQAGPRFGDYYGTHKAMTQVAESFQIWFDNSEFRSYLSDISSLFVSQIVHPVQMPPVSVPGQVKQTTTRRGFICIDDLLGPEPILDMERPRLVGLLSSHPEYEEPAPRLMAFVDSLELQSKSQYERRYVEHLRGSISSLQQKKRRDHITMDSKQLGAALLDYFHRCEMYCERIYNAIRVRLTRFDETLDSPQNSLLLETLAGIGNWPRISPYLLVQQLTHQRWRLLPERWKASIVEYGCAITALQQARRLTTLVSFRDDLIRELQNPGHTNWDPHQYPESLLLEIENDILIRDVQEQIARKMRDISSGRNAVMQLNMGEGKSSVIVPMVAAHLADGSRLVRVIVAKPQSRQMLQMLVSKLGGLLGRPVYLMPVSRSLRLTVAEADAIFHICQKCMEGGGVLLVQPEHILSLKLMCLECFVTGRDAIGCSLLRTLEFFKKYARDVVDESDENFSVKFELIYTMGVQRQLELTPQRWVIVQELVNIMRVIAPSVKKDYPRSLEVEERSKRWRVNYGPDHARNPPTRLSVPYRAKDCPAPRSEFSHPDVVILLTCLTYYYAGLSDEELFLAFDHLVKSDQAEIEYQAWLVDCPSLPETYRQLGGVNLEDRQHCRKQIFPWLRSAKGAIDYFLAHVVFPKELREFPEKLSASGWDIGEIRNQPTVGFSGTNDSRQTLPLSVQQLDLPEQSHTNALVLDCLLMPENSVALCPARQQASGLDAKVLLDMVMGLEPPVQVILDVGAQILELSSLEVAEYWLNLVPDNTQTQAVIFVNENDEICVLDRNRRVELLQVSPFAKQLGACLVFLDEAHTRGIDLKLPANYRAAVTLGAGITKDKLVQACMRMRKLGKGQSVIFCIPDEIKFKILALPNKCSRSSIDVSDVLRWAVSETWVDIRRSMPLWAAQGKRYVHQCRLWEAASQGGKVQLSLSRASEFLEPEAQSLDDRYRPRRGDAPVLHHQSDESTPMCLISERCREFDDLNFASAQLREEQERELAPEIEQERQIERPPPAKPNQHCLHEDLLTFVSTGILKEHSSAFRPAFEALRNTSAARYLDLSQFPSGLRVTTDFATTIQLREGSSSLSDTYQRPVQWVLTHSIYDSTSGKRNASQVIIISPYEAMHLLPEVRRSAGATIHLYAPRQNLSFVSLDRLDLYNIPSRPDSIDIPDDLKIQLNLFAGQLYIASYPEYLRLCDTLGVASAATPDNFSVAADGFILRGNVTSKSTFSQSPLKFLQVLLSQIRKDGQDISKTHIGKLLDGRLLELRDFDSAIEELTPTRLSIRSHPK